MSAFCLSYQKKIGKKKEKKSECFSILFCHSSSCLSMEVYHSTRRDKQNQNLFPTANFHCKVSFVNWPEIRMKTEIAIHILVFHFFFLFLHHHTEFQNIHLIRFDCETSNYYTEHFFHFLLIVLKDHFKKCVAQSWIKKIFKIRLGVFFFF